MRRLILSPLVMLAAVGAAESASASAEVREKLAELAQRILETTKNQPVTIGVFSQTGLPDSNAGPGLEGILTDQLNHIAAGIVQANAKFEVKGDYAFARVRDPAVAGLKVIKVKVRIIEKEFSEELLSVPLEVTLDHTRTVAAMLQLTAAIPPEGSKERRNERLDQQQQHRSVFIHGEGGTLVSATPDSPFDVEVLAGPRIGETRPRAVRPEQQLAYVDITRGEIYEVRIHNRSGRDVAVALTIDGLDVFHFSAPEFRREDGNPVYSNYIVHPSGHVDADGVRYDGTGTIVGWFQKLAPPDNYLSFLVTGYGEGAVSKAGIKARGQVGAIHVQFANCAPLPEGTSARSGNETGFGPPRSVEQKAVRYEIEPPHEFVTIRYTRPQE